MILLKPKAFFDLEGFAWPSLFAGAEYVWQALGRLPQQLADHPEPRIEGRVSAAAWLEGPGIVIEDGAVVEPGAYIQGPVWVGPGAQVRHTAYIRGPALIGAGAVVGHASEVKASVFLPGAKAGHFAYVGDSVLGRDVNLGAGTKLANLRLDGRNIIVNVDGKPIDTGLRKFGAVLGDGCELGCNAVANPGTLLGPGCLVHPAIAVHGAHRAHSRLRRSCELLSSAVTERQC